MSSEGSQFDFVVVGAGSSGCVVASRLAEAGFTVCLIEAGPIDGNPMIHIPAGFIRAVSNPALSWGFASMPVPGLDDRVLPLVQGKVVGGSSSINGMVYNRCQSGDYDCWAQSGCPGWSHTDVLPFFRKSERRLGYESRELRGEDGPIAVSDPAYSHPLYRAFIEAACAQGARASCDYNGREQDGVGAFQFTIDTSRRWVRRSSAASAFLKPAMKTGRIALQTDSFVAAIECEDSRARRVRYRPDKGKGPEKSVTARREIIVSAGALNTPRLLETSGIGSPDHIRSLGRAVIVALPGVGANLSDHYQVRLSAELAGVVTFNELSRGANLAGQIARWLVGRPSLLSLGPVPMRLFHRSDPALSHPDLQMSFTPGSFKDGETGRLDTYPGMTIGGYQQRPHSRGHIHAASMDLRECPLIQPNYLAEEIDRRAIVSVIRKARQLLRSPAFEPWFVREVFPGDEVGDSDEEILGFAKRSGGTAFHHSGTAKMGPRSDRMAVVDEFLRVHGCDGLRVADASVFPAPLSGNYNAPAIMVGERAAAMILESGR